MPRYFEIERFVDSSLAMAMSGRLDRRFDQAHDNVAMAGGVRFARDDTLSEKAAAQAAQIFLRDQLAKALFEHAKIMRRRE